MSVSRLDDAGTLETGSGFAGRPDGRPAGQAAGRPRLPFAAATAPVERPVLHDEDAAIVRSCWMCGIHLSGDQMMADGGSACADLRWYCRDTWACTQRWTSRPARGAARRGSRAEPPKPSGKQATGADVAPPVLV